MASPVHFLIINDNQNIRYLHTEGVSPFKPIWVISHRAAALALNFSIKYIKGMGTSYISYAYNSNSNFVHVATFIAAKISGSFNSVGIYSNT